MPINENVLNAIKKAILETGEAPDFARVHDCIVDVLKVKPDDEQVKKIIRLLPATIIGEAIKWGFRDTVVGDSVFEWLKDNKETALAAIGQQTPNIEGGVDESK